MVNSNDFEVHPIGTAKELKMLRDLVTEMFQLQTQYGKGIFSISISEKLNKMIDYYINLSEDERYKNGI